MSRILTQFSTNRLNGEPVPDDVKILLAHRTKLARRTGIELNANKHWAPWLDTSYLSAEDRANPDTMANVRAIEEVCGLIAFIAVDEEDQYYGYWRGSKKRPVADSPLVFFDNEGQFNLCAGKTFAEAVLASVYDEEKFTELRAWMQSLGIDIRAVSMDKLKHPKEKSQPDDLHKKLYYRYRGEGD